MMEFSWFLLILFFILVYVITFKKTFRDVLDEAYIKGEISAEEYEKHLQNR